MWQEVTAGLVKMGIPIKDAKPIETKNKVKKRVKCEPIPIKKFGDYCEGEDGNTTLPVKFNEVQSLAILDNGAGIAIATKEVWDSWGNLALRKTRMKLQIADKFIESLIGLL